MKYKASMDWVAILITVGVLVLFTFIALKPIWQIMEREGEIRFSLVSFGVILLFAGIYIGCWIFAPQSYTLNRSELKVNRVIGSVIFKISEIKSIRILEDFESRGTIRTFGVGGLFGYYGKFYIPKIGSSNFYATQRKNKILLELRDGRNIVITPDDLGLYDRLTEYKNA